MLGLFYNQQSSNLIINGSCSLTFFLDLCPTYEYKVNEYLKAMFSKLSHVDIEQMGRRYLDSDISLE